LPHGGQTQENNSWGALSFFRPRHVCQLVGQWHGTQRCMPNSHQLSALSGRHKRNSQPADQPSAAAAIFSRGLAARVTARMACALHLLRRVARYVTSKDRPVRTGEHRTSACAEHRRSFRLSTGAGILHQDRPWGRHLSRSLPHCAIDRPAAAPSNMTTVTIVRIIVIRNLRFD
jgi:hypothetical protein